MKEIVCYVTASKNKGDFSFSVDELKIFIWFLLFSSYHKLPSEANYWSYEKDLDVSLIKTAMSRNRFQTVKCRAFL